MLNVSSIPQNLVEELTTFLEADVQTIQLFNGNVNNGPSPRSADLPTLVFWQAETDRMNTLKPGFGIDHITFHFEVRAADSSVAQRLAGQLKGRLLPNTLTSYVPVPFVGPYGNERGRYTKGPHSTMKDPELGPNNTDIWSSSFPITWIIAIG